MKNEQIADQILAALQELLQLAGPEWTLEALAALQELLQLAGPEWTLEALIALSPREAS